MRGLLPDKLVMSLILGSEGQRSGTPRLTFWPSPRPGVQTEGGFAGNRLHEARNARRKLGGSLSKCAEGGALSCLELSLQHNPHVGRLPTVRFQRFWESLASTSSETRPFRTGNSRLRSRR